MERTKQGKTGELLLGGNHAYHGDFKDDRIYKTGPNFLNKYSCKQPTRGELDQAQNSLTLLKSKMCFNPVGNNYNNGPSDLMDHNFNRNRYQEQDNRGMGRGNTHQQENGLGHDNSGNSNYRRVFKPGNTMEDIERKEKMLINNIGMLNDNQDIQKEILGSHVSNVNSGKNVPVKNDMRQNMKANNHMGRQQRNSHQGGIGEFDNKNNENDHYGKSDKAIYNFKRGPNAFDQAPHNDYQGNQQMGDSRNYSHPVENRNGGGVRGPRGSGMQQGGHNNNELQHYPQSKPSDYPSINRNPHNQKNEQVNSHQKPPQNDKFKPINDEYGRNAPNDPYARKKVDNNKPRNQQNNDPWGNNQDQNKNEKNNSSQKYKVDQPNKNTWDFENINANSNPNDHRGRGGFNNQPTNSNQNNQNLNDKRNYPSNGERDNNNFNMGQRNQKGSDRDLNNYDRQRNEMNSGTNRMNSNTRRPERRLSDSNNFGQDQNNKMGNQMTKNEDMLHEERPIHDDRNDDIKQQAREDENVGLKQCPEGCGRTFKEEALEKHMKICKKVFQSKRKKFDITKQRLEPEQQGNYKLGGGNGGPKKNANKFDTIKNKNAGKQKWKAQSEALRAQMTQMRGVDHLSANEQKAISDAIADADPDRAECPYCGRKFGGAQLERHEPICKQKNALAKMKSGPPPKRGGGAGMRKR